MGVNVRDIVNNRPRGLRRARALLEEQLGKAFAENGGNVREAVACGGTAEELTQETLDVCGRTVVDAKGLREVAAWALAAAGLLDARKAGAK
jgi:hypothetical protein